MHTQTYTRIILIFLSDHRRIIHTWIELIMIEMCLVK